MRSTAFSCGAAADDLLEVVLAEDLFAQVDVLAFELRLEAADLLVLAHVLDRERQLVGDLLQEFGFRLAVLHRLHAAEVQRADARAAHDQRYDDQRAEALANRTSSPGYLRSCARSGLKKDAD